MTIKAILFDLDGTLLDTAPDFVHTINQLAAEYNIDAPTPDAIRQQVSNGARAMVKLLFQINEGHESFNARREKLLETYENVMGKYCVLFDGMSELLENINNNDLAWGIITNKPVRYAKPIVNNLSFDSPPAVLICPDHVKNTKPDPEAMFLACEQLQCEPHEVVYIGDHQRDIDCGRNAGTKTIAVSFGYITEGDDITRWQADYIAQNVDDIWNYINPLVNR